MPFLQPKDREVVQQRITTELKRDVNVTLYTQVDIGLFIPGRECRYCGPTQDLLEELSALSPKIHLEVVDFYKNQERALSSGIVRIPAITVGNGDRDNVRFYGMPLGFEFVVLLNSIIGASQKGSPLQVETRRQLKRLKDDVHVQVMVTPNCQYCPTVAGLAHAMAIESPKVTADVIEVQEFRDVVAFYNVMGVPKTVINDRVVFSGAVPEKAFLRHILRAVGVEEVEEEEIEPVSDQTTPI